MLGDRPGRLPGGLLGCLLGGLVALACSPVEAPVLEEAVPADLPVLPGGFQRGMNIEPIGDYGDSLDLQALDADLELLHRLGVDHVALIPSFFQPRLGDTSFVWRGSRQEVAADTRRAIRMAHARGLRVLLKPHLWLEDRSDGAWRGDIDPDEAEWEAWQRSYRDAVLEYARMGAEEEVAGISIGSELTRLALRRPEFWRQLAAEVRAVFPGWVTYAANWDREFESILWWDAMDLAGVDAFWPLVDSAEADTGLPALQARLEAILAELRRISRAVQRPVLVTEIGYKSARGAAHRPWEWHGDTDTGAADPALQRDIYEAIARVFGAGAAEPEAWLRGAYFWVWYMNPRWAGPDNADFTPRGKPAERVLEAWFSGH